MNPVAKYYLARVAIIAVVAVPLMFFINALAAVAAGLIMSLVLGLLLLRKQRDAMIAHIDEGVKRRREEKQKLRAELSGE